MSAKKATHQQTKQHNRDLVLRQVFKHPTISRAQIARVTKLTRPTVSDIVGNLIDEGLVEEVGYGKSIGGKMPILLSLIPDSRHLIGLNLSQEKFIGAIVNLRGEIKKTEEITVSDSDGEKALKNVYQILDRLVDNTLKPIVGIGVGTQGLVNTRDGIVVKAVNLEWQNLPLAQMLEERYRIPVSVLNDSQANAIGVFVYGGDHKADSNLVVVNARHGIGAGILINGQLFQGDGFGAGEIGHVTVQEDGLLCRCGQRGCLEAIASPRAVVQRVKDLAKDFKDSVLTEDIENVSLDSIVSAYQEKDPLAQLVINDAAHYLGLSIASLVGTLNIQKIILTGNMVRFGQPWLETVRESMLKGSLRRMSQDTQLEIGDLEFQGCILGASFFILLESYSLLFNQSNE